MHTYIHTYIQLFTYIHIHTNRDRGRWVRDRETVREWWEVEHTCNAYENE